MKVSLANCTCRIGKSGFCTHVALVLWRGAQDITRTDCPARWKDGSTKQTPWFKEPPAPLNDLVPSRRPSTRWSDVSHVDELSGVLESLGIKCPFVVLHKSHLRQPEKRAETLVVENNVVQHLLSLYEEVQNNLNKTQDDSSENEDDASRITLEDLFRLRDTDIRVIERETRGPSNRHKWVKIRMGRITASQFGQVWMKLTESISIFCLLFSLISHYFIFYFAFHP